jgi:hypothetical protein
MWKNVTIAVVAASILAIAGLPSWAEDHDDLATLAKALPQASLPLEKACKVSEREGKPVSAKYELENGALQLSIYTMKGSRFSELIIDHTSGAVAKEEWITDADDMKAAQAQAAAMAKGKVTLDVAIANAVNGNAGFRAVSATPTLEADRPVAVVILMKGEDVKKVTEKLD